MRAVLKMGALKLSFGGNQYIISQLIRSEFDGKFTSWKSAFKESVYLRLLIIICYGQRITMSRHVHLPGEK